MFIDKTNRSMTFQTTFNLSHFVPEMRELNPPRPSPNAATPATVLAFLET